MIAAAACGIPFSAGPALKPFRHKRGLTAQILLQARQSLE